MPEASLKPAQITTRNFSLKSLDYPDEWKTSLIQANTDVTSRLEVAKKTITASEHELSRLQTTVQATQSNLTESKDLNASLSYKNTALERDLEQHKELTRKETERLQTLLDGIETAYVGLQTRLHISEDNAASEVQAKDKAQSECSPFTSQITMFKKKLNTDKESAQTKAKRLQSLLDRSNDEGAELRRRLRTSEDDAASKAQTRDKAESECVSLNSRIAELNAQLKAGKELARAEAKKWQDKHAEL